MNRARHAVRADLGVLEVALARAFHDDPMTSWVIGVDDDSDRVARAALGFFRPSLSIGLQKGHVYTVDSLGGAAIWAPPDVNMFDESDGATFGAALHEHVGEAALTRIMALGEMVARHHPHDVPHFYLFILGSAEPGNGLGGQLVQPVLDRCDHDGLGAYLESSTERNLTFYERHGFRVQWEDRPAADGPMIRGMWRDPQH